MLIGEEEKEGADGIYRVVQNVEIEGEKHDGAER